LLGDRVFVEFFQLADEATGIQDIDANVQRSTFNVQRPTFNLSGQRVNASYKGIILQNGRKMIKR
jgi:hypothetical protein